MTRRLLPARRAMTAATVAMAAALLLTGQATCAAPIVPTSDDTVIETLPQRSAGWLEERRLRQALRQRPEDSGLALALAQKRLAEARETGDPHLAGMALAAIAPWAQAQDAPTPVLLMRATLQQSPRRCQRMAPPPRLCHRTLSSQPRWRRSRRRPRRFTRWTQ